MRFTSYLKKENDDIKIKDDIEHLLEVHEMMVLENNKNGAKKNLIDIRIGLNYLLSYYFDKIKKSIIIQEIRN